MRSERNVNAQTVSLRDYFPLHARTTAVEHLELEALAWEPFGSNKLLDCGNQPAIVRCDARIVSMQQEPSRLLEVLRADLRHRLVGDLGALVVCALDQPHASAQRDRVLDVGGRALQVRLQHGADVRVCREGFLENAQRSLDDRRALHIDAHERIAVSRRAIEDCDEVLQRKSFVEE